MNNKDDFDNNAEEDFSGNEDNFGLPDVEYEPLQEDNELDKENDEDNPKYSFPDDDDDDDSTFSGGKILIILTILVLLVGGGFLLYSYVIKPNQEKEKREELAKQERKKQIEKEKKLARIEEEKKEKRKQLVADSVAQMEATTNEHPSSTAMSENSSATIVRLNTPTGQYHIVISSAIDDDLLMDYAKIMKKKRIGSKIIAPYGNTKFYRLAIGDSYATRADAQSKINEIGTYHTGEAWILKY